MDHGGRVNERRTPPIDALARRLRRQDPVQVSRRARVVYDLSEGAYDLPFVGRPARCWPKHPSGLWTDAAPAEPLKPLQLRIALAYLVTAHSTPREPEAWETAADVPGEARTALAAAFGRDAAGLIRAARKLGGRRSQIGEFAAEIALLPRVAVRIRLEEGPAAGRRASHIEFSGGATDQLPPDMLAALLDMAVTRLIDAAQ